MLDARKLNVSSVEVKHTPASRWRKYTHRLALLPACVRAIAELAIARLRHLSLEPRDIIALNCATAQRASSTASTSATAKVELVAYLIPRIAARLPWRADCLVQALAAQHWLRRQAIASQITIGVDRTAGGDFAAHAWLTHDGQIVTGGEISGYSPLLVPESSV